MINVEVFDNSNVNQSKSGLEWGFSADQFKPMP